MLNIVYALVVGAVVSAGLFLPGLLRLGEATVPGVLIALIAYFLLARRTFKQLEGIFTAGAKSLQKMPPRFDLAIATFEKAYPLGRVQIGIRTQIDSQIGVTYFLQKEFAKAQPYLQRSQGFGHWLGTAMLAVVHYKKKNPEQMRNALMTATKKAKKQSLAWTLRAYLLSQIGEREAAMAALTEGLKKTQNDPKIKEALLALQNGKKIKMRSYKEQWYQFHLERPPAQYQQQTMPQRLGKVARRGRW